VTWQEAFDSITSRLRHLPGEKIGAIAGNLCDAESMFALKQLMAALGSTNLDCRQDGAALDTTRREFYIFNTTIAGIDEADALLIIGSNPRREAPVLNARIRKRWIAGGFKIGLIGTRNDLTYPAEHLGEGPGALNALLDGSSAFVEALKAAKTPMIILGASALAREDGAAILAAAWKIAASFGALNSDWHGFNILHQAAGRVGGLDLGFVPGANGINARQMLGGGVAALWLLGTDEIDTRTIPPGTFVIYQGHHGDAGAARADVILPGAAYTEKDGTYVNTEGRAQRGCLAIKPPGEAREDWRIIRAISADLDHALPYESISELRTQMAALYPVFAQIGEVKRLAGTDVSPPAGNPAAMSSLPFADAMPNYYQTDAISRASPTMAACVAAHYPVLAEAAE
jgi:NADH-quinone oxidoreductase subunit G